MDIREIECITEALLFAKGEPVSVKDISTVTQTEEKSVKAIIKNLADRYEKEKRGIRIIEINEGFQMCTNPEYTEMVKKLYQTPPKKNLSQTLLETLAIIAYKQPITKGMIEQIRGVNADHAVNKLVEYDLVCEKGRLDAPGRPILFGTTEEFLRAFGFKSIENMPQIQIDDEKLKAEAEQEIDSFEK